MDSDEHYLEPETSQASDKLRSIVDYAILDEKSQNIVEKFVKRKLPKVITESYDDDKKGIEKRLEKTDLTLANLLQDGRELITNIRVANDKREVDRRIKEAELREELFEKLQQESIEATKKFEIISSQWAELEELKDPMGLYVGLDEQKMRIAELMKQKDDIIGECCKELHAADKRYLQDLDKQKIDLDFLVERIDSQIEMMEKSYKKQLEVLESKIYEERHILRIAATKRWDDLHRRQSVSEKIKMQKEKELLEMYTKEVDRIRLTQEEEIRATRTRLELDNQALQIELERTKAAILSNKEKLNYNYKVLKKREDENVVIRNQQKRRLDRLREIVGNFRKKIKELIITCNIETEKFTHEIKKLHATVYNLEIKNETFVQANALKFQKIWEMNKAEGMKLLKIILEMDKGLTEQQLELEWVQPEINLLKNNAFSFPGDVTEKKYLRSNADTSITRVNNLSTIQTPFDDRRLIKTIFKKICDRTGFLVEKKLFSLLKDFTDNQKQLIQLNNVFNALGINQIEDISYLKEFFLPFAWCKICTNKKYLQDVEDSERDKSNDDFQNFSMTQYDKKKIERVKCSEHLLLIDVSNVLTALKQFAQTKFNMRTYNDSKYASGDQVKRPSSRTMKKDDITEFWKQFDAVFQKQKIWEFLETGLNEYLKVLKEREKLDEECEFLKKQNIELNHLLQRFDTNNQFN